MHVKIDSIINPSISKYLILETDTPWLFILLAGAVGLAGSLFGIAFAPIGC